MLRSVIWTVSSGSVRMQSVPTGRSAVKRTETAWHAPLFLQKTHLCINGLLVAGAGHAHHVLVGTTCNGHDIHGRVWALSVIPHDCAAVGEHD